MATGMDKSPPKHLFFGRKSLDKSKTVGYYKHYQVRLTREFWTWDDSLWRLCVYETTVSVASRADFNMWDDSFLRLTGQEAAERVIYKELCERKTRNIYNIFMPCIHAGLEKKKAREKY